MSDMFSISNSEINKLPEIVTKGMIIMHQHDDGTWEEAKLEYGKIVQSSDPTVKPGSESNSLAFYTLKNGTCYLGAVGGKLLQRDNLKLKIDNPSTN